MHKSALIFFVLIRIMADGEGILTGSRSNVLAKRYAENRSRENKAKAAARKEWNGLTKEEKKLRIMLHEKKLKENNEKRIRNAKKAMIFAGPPKSYVSNRMSDKDRALYKAAETFNSKFMHDLDINEDAAIDVFTKVDKDGDYVFLGNTFCPEILDLDKVLSVAVEKKYMRLLERMKELYERLKGFKREETVEIAKAGLAAIDNAIDVIRKAEATEKAEIAERIAAAKATANAAAGAGGAGNNGYNKFKAIVKKRINTLRKDKKTKGQANALNGMLSTRTPVPETMLTKKIIEEIETDGLKNFLKKTGGRRRTRRQRR